MKILQISDIHGSETAVEYAQKVARRESVDAVFVAGDVTNFGTVEEAEGLLEVIADSGSPVFFVAGNCDPPQLLQHRPREDSVVNVHGRRVELGGLLLLGLGGSGRTPSGATWIEFSEEEFEELLGSLNWGEGPSILISHSPPRGVEADSVSGKHLGSAVIRRYVELHRPILVSCGHVHEARSVCNLSTTLVVNAGPAKNGWCALIEVENERVKARLGRLQ